MRFSASRVKTWMRCPLQAHFHYDLQLPSEGNNAKAVFGNAIHAALEHYNNHGDLIVALGMFNDLWANPEKLGAPTETLRWPKRMTYGGLKERGNQILRDTHEKLSLEKRVVLGTEHKFLVPFGDHELTGYVDLLEVRTSGRGKNIVRIVDYKTAGKQPNFGELYLDVQFTIYQYASMQPEFWFGNGPDFPPLVNADWAHEMYFNLPRRAIWYHLMSVKEIDAGPRDDDDYMRLYRVCEMIQKAEDQGVFVPKIGEECTLCDFREPCGTPIPAPEDVAAQDDAWI